MQTRATTGAAGLATGKALGHSSKAPLFLRAIGSEPAVVRRLLSSSSVNPTLGTLAEVAAALGMKVVLQPMTPEERQDVTEPMIQGISVKQPVST